MRTLDDYVRWIAESMNIHLHENTIKEITNKLINNEKYKEVLHELEDEIIKRSKTDPEHRRRMMQRIK